MMNVDVPVRYSPDVCVIGAGVAGLSAAVAAARAGMSVVIVEKYGFSGGAAIAGLSGTICGLYGSGDRPEQIVYGFANEFYQQLKARSATSSPVGFGKTVLIAYDALIWKEIADQYLVNHNIRILYHTYFLKASTTENGTINSVSVKGPGGIFAINPKVVIDASGDAEVVNSITGAWFFGKEGVVQTPTMIFKMGNVNMEAYLKMDPNMISQKINEQNNIGNYNLPRSHVYSFPLPNSGEVLCNMTKITYPDGRVPSGISAEDLTYAEIEGRKQARQYAVFLQEQIPAFRNSYITDTGVQVGIRQSRSIKGMEMLTNDDVLSARKRAGAVTFSAWPIELHSADGVQISYLQNNYYDIPFGALVPEKSVNLLAAGRCICAEHEALASARVTAQCFGMGYAIGAASALMVSENLTAVELSGEMVLEGMKQYKLKNAHEQ